MRLSIIELVNFKEEINRTIDSQLEYLKIRHTINDFDTVLNKERILFQTVSYYERMKSIYSNKYSDDDGDDNFDSDPEDVIYFKYTDSDKNNSEDEFDAINFDKGVGKNNSEKEYEELFRNRVYSYNDNDNDSSHLDKIPPLEDISTEGDTFPQDIPRPKKSPDLRYLFDNEISESQEYIKKYYSNYHRFRRDNLYTSHQYRNYHNGGNSYGMNQVDYHDINNECQDIEEKKYLDNHLKNHLKYYIEPTNIEQLNDDLIVDYTEPINPSE